MVSKIFTILEGIKKASTISKTASVTAVDKIVNEITNGDINPVEAYVMLDYLSKVTGEALKSIKPNTLDYIQKEGENSAFGVQLQLIERKDYAYEEDKEWSDINRKMSVFKDALKVREKFIKDIVDQSIDAEQKAPISYTKTIFIRPNSIS